MNLTENLISDSDIAQSYNDQVAARITPLQARILGSPNTELTTASIGPSGPQANFVNRDVLGGGGDDPLLDVAIVQRIIDLHEIGLLARQYGLDGGEVGVACRGDADVAANALRFPFLELCKRLLRIAYIVQLQQIELFSL